MRLLTLMTSLFMFSLSSFSQSDTTKDENQLQKNTIYATGGTVLYVLYGEIAFERMAFSKNKKFLNSIWIKASAGSYSSWEFGGPTYSLRSVYLSGLRNHHLEASLGVAAIFDKVGYPYQVSNARYNNESTPSKLESTYFSPAGSIGYRHQKPNGDFIFRSGIGFPETIYLGLGFCF